MGLPWAVCALTTSTEGSDKLGLFGPAAATALEDLPYDARGVLSGLFEQGYAMGYLLAAVFYRAVSSSPG